MNFPEEALIKSFDRPVLSSVEGHERNQPDQSFPNGRNCGSSQPGAGLQINSDSAPPRFRHVLLRIVSRLVPGLLMASWMSLAADHAFALDSDSKQPIYIEANTATYDEKKGETVYTGDVKATQGSLEVRGDQMTVYQKGGATEKIIVTGDPTRLKQTPEGGKEDIHGTSQRADYFPDTGILILYDKALVWQGQNSTASDIIEYDTKNGLFTAGSPNTGSKRVHVKMQPKEKSK
ncbi:lipopolysaccharide transport periplasmic protein LptA [Methylocaldum marinum]|nr:lipopolysaccharide transport periplasmic protein LptA [Methylocaldum marinum]